MLKKSSLAFPMWHDLHFGTWEGWMVKPFRNALCVACKGLVSVHLSDGQWWLFFKQVLIRLRVDLDGWIVCWTNLFHRSNRPRHWGCNESVPQRESVHSTDFENWILLLLAKPRLLTYQNLFQQNSILLIVGSFPGLKPSLLPAKGGSSLRASWLLSDQWAISKNRTSRLDGTKMIGSICQEVGTTWKPAILSHKNFVSPQALPVAGSYHCFDLEHCWAMKKCGFSAAFLRRPPSRAPMMPLSNPILSQSCPAVPDSKLHNHLFGSKTSWPCWLCLDTNCSCIVNRCIAVWTFTIRTETLFLNSSAFETAMAQTPFAKNKVFPDRSFWLVSPVEVFPKAGMPWQARQLPL